MTRAINKTLSALVAIPMICLLFIFGGMPLVEGYNIFSPYIDTEFAKGYSPELFDEITIDLTMDEVKSILGDPLFIFKDTINGKIEIRYIYTNDGYFRRAKKSDRYMIGDFAWYRSSVSFDEDRKIIRIDKGWSYD